MMIDDDDDDEHHLWTLHHKDATKLAWRFLMHRLATV